MNQDSRVLEAQNLAWLRVIILAISAFVFNTTEFIPIALLSDISRSFAMTEAETGLMITAYAWVVALVSLPLMLLTGKIERRKLLMGVFALFIVGHIVTAMAGSFAVLLLGRILIAFAHAVFWSVTAALAIRLAPEGKRSQALGILAAGTSIATVLGLPIGRLIGQWLGWQQTFLSIGGLAFIALLAIAMFLPALPSVNSGSLKNLPGLFKKPALLGIFAITVVIFTAHFAAYTYIEPFSEQIVHMSNKFTTVLLLIFGGAGIIGSIIFSRYNTTHPAQLLLGAMSIVSCALLVLLLLGQTQWSFITIALIWGVAITCIGLGLQVKVLDLAPEATDLAMSIFSGIINIGIGLGALVGNQVIRQLGLNNIGYVSGVIGLLALLMGAWLFKCYYVQLTAKMLKPVSSSIH